MVQSADGDTRLRPIRLRPAGLFELGPFDLGQFDLGQFDLGQGLKILGANQFDHPKCPEKKNPKKGRKENNKAGQSI